MEQKKNASKYYKFALYLVIVVLINLVAARLLLRTDLTANNLYSLSKASKRVVSTLKEPLTINVFFSKNLPAPYNIIEPYLRDMLEAYASHANRYLSYRFFNVSAKEGDLSEEAEENRKKAQDYGIYPVNVQKIERDEAKVQRAYMGMVLIHGDIVEKIPAITSTEGLEYTITSTIQRMHNKISALLNLEEKIRVKLVQSSSIDRVAPEVGLEGLAELRENIQRLVDEANAKVYDQLQLVFIDPSKTPLSESEQERYGRFGLRWPELRKADGTVIPAGEGIVALGIEYGEKSLERQLLNRSLQLTGRGLQEQFQVADTEELKKFIEENVDNLINIHEEIGYLTSHDTLPLSPELPPQFQRMQPEADSLTRFNALLSDNYTVTRIDLKDEDIPESIDTLILAGPKEPFSDWELFQIDQFLMKGKSLAVFVETFKELQQQQNQMYGMQEPVYLPLNTGLEKLLDHYGATVKKAYVMDESCFVNRDRTSGETPIYFAPIIKNENINHRLGFLKNIKELIMIRMSPVSVDTEKIKAYDLKAKKLFSSSADSWEMSGRINLMPWMIRPPASGEEKKSQPLAYLIEGGFPSYFADKPVPEKPEKQEEAGENQEEKASEKEKGEPPVEETKIEEGKGLLVRGRPGKIFLIGSAEILKDNVLDEEGRSPNSVFLLNTIDYLNDQEDIAVMRSKNQRFNPLKDTKASTRAFVKILNIGGLPLLFVFFGFVVWFRRKAKRRTIQAMFTPQKERRP